MTRARLLKPGFFLNEDLAELPYPARILFAGLWCLADREGRLEDRPKRIKHETLPYDDENVDALLSKLHEAGFIVRYVANDVRYIQVVHFSKHQSPHIKESPSAIPPPAQARCKHGASTVQARDTHEASPSEAEAEAEADTESVAEAEADTRQQQQRHARTHARESELLDDDNVPTDAEADAIADTETEPLPTDGNALEAEVAAAPAATTKRQALTAFRRQFADAAGLAAGERSLALDAIITAYRPRAPDAELIVEATNCRDYYASRKTKRTVDCRLLANWLARWADRRAVSQRQQQQTREDMTHDQGQHPAAVGAAAANGASRGRGGGYGRPPVDLPDPTRNGRWAHLVKTYPDDE